MSKMIHIHINITDVMGNKDLMSLFVNTKTGKQATAQEIQDMLIDEISKGYSELPLAKCNNRKPDGSCAGNEEDGGEGVALNMKPCKQFSTDTCTCLRDPDDRVLKGDISVIEKVIEATSLEPIDHEQFQPWDDLAIFDPSSSQHCHNCPLTILGNPFDRDLMAHILDDIMYSNEGAALLSIYRTQYKSEVERDESDQNTPMIIKTTNIGENDQPVFYLVAPLWENYLEEPACKKWRGQCTCKFKPYCGGTCLTNNQKCMVSGILTQIQALEARVKELEGVPL